MLRILVLGSAAGGGFPQWNCNCSNCRIARAGGGKTSVRTQSSLAVSADGRSWWILNASPDIGWQIARTPALQPADDRPRSSPIAGVVLTNADVDHVAGLLSLRERQPLTVYGTTRVLDVLAANPIFDVLAPSTVPRLPLPLDRPIDLASVDGAATPTVTAFAVPGKVALWLEALAGDDMHRTGEDTIGLELNDGDGGRCFYVPACARLTPELAARLRGADLVFFDGTTWSDDEMRSAGVGEKTAGRMGHLSMSGPDGSIAAFESLDVRRKVFVHINNTNPVLIAGSAERAEAERHGWEIAEDGGEYRL